MKKNPRVQEQLSDGFPKKPIPVRNFSSLDQRTESSQKQQVGYSQDQLFDDDSGFRLGLVQENEDFQSLDEHVSEGEKDIDPKEIENDVFEIENESLPLQEQQDDQPDKGKKIYGQPIGQDKVTLGKFSRFLGSLARDSNLAPLNELDWRLVHDKDKIWDYVKEQAEGKPPSVALMYMETHKRTPGKNYKTAEVNIPYRDEIVKDTIAGVLKMLEHLPSDVLAPIASSFENRLGVPEFATNLINGQSSQGINDTELYQVDEDGDGEANEDGDLYENLEN
ncbi:hypothetical protein PHJA_001965000 [Phtheirospermum japonicum]|uniref:Uncharacterized protein n=1 Tax=Phtheirospermum japonicum TaxID=374723 RepID=A0A830CF10_9LAMI|nr:hypothetical protein PHJA_001965000 [Phtheirospermum japonicum]